MGQIQDGGCQLNSNKYLCTDVNRQEWNCLIEWKCLELFNGLEVPQWTVGSSS